MISSNVVTPASSFAAASSRRLGILRSRARRLISPSFAPSTIRCGEVFVDRQELEQADASAVATAVALFATARFVNGGPAGFGPADGGGFGGRELSRLAAFGAQPPRQPLRDAEADGCGDLEWFESHVDRAA